jgi:uncharacterized membrane protein
VMSSQNMGHSCPSAVKVRSSCTDVASSQHAE